MFLERGGGGGGGERWGAGEGGGASHWGWIQQGPIKVIEIWQLFHASKIVLTFA